MQEIGKFKPNINVIPNNMEKYMAFMLGKHPLFHDSFQFMTSSHDSLVQNLPNDAFNYTSEKFQGERRKLLSKKGVYPCNYMDSLDKLKVTHEKTTSTVYLLTSTCPTRPTTRGERFLELENMGGYHDIYLKGDVPLLTDVSPDKHQ